MVIDSSHRNWFWGVLAGLAITCAVYGIYAVRAPRQIFGGTGLGIAYGAMGLALMAAAGLLGARRRMFSARNPTLRNFAWRRLGRMQYWMRAHLWLGFLSFPVILLHSGFSLGTGLTRVLIVLFAAVFVSGVAGAALQHYMPAVMTARVPREVTYDQIGAISQHLLEEAERATKAACEAAKAGKYEAVVGSATQPQMAGSSTTPSEAYAQRLAEFFETQVLPWLGPANRAQLESAREAKRDSVRKEFKDQIRKELKDKMPKPKASDPPEVKAQLMAEFRAASDRLDDTVEDEFHRRRQEIEEQVSQELPRRINHLAQDSRDSIFATSESLSMAFAAIGIRLPLQMADALGSLEDICAEQRELRQQARLHRWLHGWLLVHVPLSYAVLALAGIHAVMALRY